MKKVLLIMMILLVCSCSAETSSLSSEITEDSDMIHSNISSLDIELYSHYTVIVSVERKFEEDELNALLEKYNLNLKYDYQTMNMYALSSPVELSDEELDELINNLLKEDNIIAVNKDYISQLDTQPVTPKTEEK